MAARLTELTADPLTPALTHHGEGPVWDTSAGALHWVDMLAGDLLTCEFAEPTRLHDEVDGSVVRRHLGDDVLAVARPRVDGGLVLARERRFALLDPGATEPHLLPELWTEPGIRLNEGGCDPQGRFYCGSMAYDKETGRGSLYRLDPDGMVEVVLTGVTISNGLAFSPDGATAYYVDTPTGRVDAFAHDAETGTLHDRRPAVEVPVEAGRPDGLTVDADGGLWVALFGGAAVHRYTPDGELDVVVRLPVQQVTAVTFGGPDSDRLFITTSREAMDAPEELAGAVFGASAAGHLGQPTLPFAG